MFLGGAAGSWHRWQIPLHLEARRAVSQPELLAERAPAAALAAELLPHLLRQDPVRQPTLPPVGEPVGLVLRPPLPVLLDPDSRLGAISRSSDGCTFTRSIARSLSSGCPSHLTRFVCVAAVSLLQKLGQYSRLARRKNVTSESSHTTKSTAAIAESAIGSFNAECA